MHAPRPISSTLPEHLRCSAKARDGELTLRPEGEWDIAGTAMLDAEHDRNADGCRSLIVDLRGLRFIDCAGVHQLLHWSADAARDFRLVPGPESVQRVFRLTGVTQALGLPERSLPA